MKTVLVAVLIAVLAAGCTYTRVDANSNSSSRVNSVPPGTSSTSGQVSTHLQGGPAAAALIAIILLGGAIEYSREDHPMPSPGTLIPLNVAPTPELAPERRIAEQDCTRPIDLAAGNLRCR